MLRQVFTVDEWQHFTAKSIDTYTTTNGISLPGVDPLELSSSALIKDAIDMIKAESNPTYMHVKKGLLRRYATRPIASFEFCSRIGGFGLGLRLGCDRPSRSVIVGPVLRPLRCSSWSSARGCARMHGMDVTRPCMTHPLAIGLNLLLARVLDHHGCRYGHEEFEQSKFA